MNLDEVYPNRSALPAYFYENKSYVKLRRKKLILISDICNSYPQFKKLSETKKFNWLKNIERGIYYATLEKAEEHNIRRVWSDLNFHNLYHDICMKCTKNLECEKVFDKILSKEISLEEYPKMSSQDIQPWLYTNTINAIKTRLEQKVTIKECSLYTCAKCKGKKCKSEKLYNRSLDEGVNLEITCQDCGHKWTG